MLVNAREVLVKQIEKLTQSLTDIAHRYADLPMLARTHGQPASPTTIGKEVANFVARIRRAHRRDWSQRRDSRQVERRGRQLQRASSSAASDTRLAGDQSRLRRIAGPRAQPVHDADRAARLDRRVLRCCRRDRHGAHRPVPRLLGLHLARFLPAAAECERSRLVDDAAQGESDRLRECRRQSRRRQRAAPALRGQAAHLALAA